MIKTFDNCVISKADVWAINAVLFLVWPKKFGPAQNILGPVKGQSIKDAKESILYKFPRIYLAFGMI